MWMAMEKQGQENQLQQKHYVSSLQENGHVANSLINLESGNGTVGCEPLEQFKGAITLIFDSICAGYEILAANYPANISYTINE